MNTSSKSAHKSRAQSSTTLNRKYVRRPAATAVSNDPIAMKAKISSQAAARYAAHSAAAAQSAAAAMKSDTMKRRQALAAQLNRERLQKAKAMHPATSRMVTPNEDPLVSAKAASATNTTKATKTATKAAKTQKKDKAVESAMRSVATMHEASGKLHPSRTFTMKRIFTALACSALIVGAIVFFITNNSPDLPVTVAAIQSDIDTVYPAHIPRGYSLSSVVSESGKISMTFSMSSGESFILTEENSSWDSATLEKNSVKSTFDSYTTVTEGGLTLFISGSDCMWVNTGKKFHIDASGNNLTNKQLKAIAASL